MTNKSDTSHSAYKRTLLSWGLLLILFAVSVVIRIQHIGQPFKARHDWLSAHTLITLKIWDKEGIAHHHFTSVYTFDNEADKFDYTVCGLIDEKGDAYYTSYGPFALIVPYVVFKLLHLPFTETALGIFGLCLHFLTSIGVYLIILRAGPKVDMRLSPAALLGYTLYVFAPGPLWFHCNVYFSEIFMQLIFAWGLYIFLQIVRTPEPKNRLLLWLFGLVCFIGTYTEWLGLFFGFCCGLYFLWRAFYNKIFLPYFFVAAVCTTLALLLIVFQYSSIAGFEKWLNVSLNKLSERSGMNATHEHTSGFQHLGSIISDYALNFLNVLLYFIPLGVISIRYRIKKQQSFFTPQQKAVLYVGWAAVLMHHIIFFNFTYVHEFSIIKTGLITIVHIGFFVYNIQERYAHRIQQFYTIAGSLILVSLLVGTIDYINKNKAKQPVDLYKKIGAVVAQYATSKEEVFVNMSMCPQLVFYSERNVQFDIASGVNAFKHSQTYGMPTIFFRIENDTCIYFTRHQPGADSVQVFIK